MVLQLEEETKVNFKKEERRGTMERRKMRKVEFDCNIYDVDLEVRAVVDDDGYIDELTVYAGGVIITEIIDETVMEQIREKIKYEASDWVAECTKADNERMDI